VHRDCPITAPAQTPAVPEGLVRDPEFISSNRTTHFLLELVVLIVNVVSILTMPPAIGFLLILANDHEIMGWHRNTRRDRWAGVLYAITVTFPAFHL
jgi:Mn2+/Fe2+ NRAMP family transporter